MQIHKKPEPNLLEIFIRKIRNLLRIGRVLTMPHGLSKTAWTQHAISLSGAILCFLYAIGYFVAGLPNIALLALGVGLLNWLSTYLNLKGHHLGATILLLGIFNISGFVFTFLFGLKSGCHLLLLLNCGLPFILFEKLSAYRIALGCGVPILLLLIAFQISSEPFLDIAPHWNKIIQNVSIFFCSVLLAISIFLLRKANENAAKALNAAMEKLQKEINLSQQIMNAMSDLIALDDHQENLLWANRAFCQFYSRPEKNLQSLVDTSLNDFARETYGRSPAILSAEQKLINESLLTGGDLAQRWFNIVKSPILNEAGQAMMYVSVYRDITKLKESESLIAYQQRQMLTSARLSALGEMAGGIAHEINNPLAIISGRSMNIRRILQLKPENKDEMVTTFASDIEQTTQRIVKIINGLKAFAREGEHDPFVKANVYEIISDVFELCSTRLENHGVKIIFKKDRASNECVIECRPVQISQVLLNIINNAFDALMKRGEEEKWVEIEVQEPDDHVEIRITDSGRGMGADISTRIFQPFFTTKALGEGIGMGLSISRGIIQSHGGSLALDESRQHTSFVIRVPRRQLERV